MDVIFLDIDYVLNGSQTKEHIGSIKGIDQKLLRLFAPLAHRPNTEIVLTSTWRLYWDKSLKDDPVKTWAGRSKKRYGRYLNAHFAEYGIEIFDKTEDFCWYRRCEEVQKYLDKHLEIENFIIFDDENFRWGDSHLYTHWVNTYELHNEPWDHGITREHISIANDILNGKLLPPYKPNPNDIF